MDKVTFRFFANSRLRLTSAFVTLLFTGIAAGQAVEKPEPQLNWKEGPSRVSLRLPMVSIDVPGGMAYIDEPRDVAVGSDYWEDPSVREALAVIGPKDGKWVAVVFSDTSAIIDENGKSWLNSNGSEGMLKRFQAQIYRRSSREQAAGRLGSRIVGWAGEPVYVGGDRRSLFLPFAQVNDEGLERVAAYGWVASSKACVHVSVILTKNQAESAVPQIKTLMDTIVLPYVPESERPKLVVQPPPPRPTPKPWYDPIVEKFGGGANNPSKIKVAISSLLLMFFVIKVVSGLKMWLTRTSCDSNDERHVERADVVPQRQPPPPPERGRFAD